MGERKNWKKKKLKLKGREKQGRPWLGNVERFLCEDKIRLKSEN